MTRVSTLFSTVGAICAAITIAGCTSDSQNGDICSTLKIAGGEECDSPPKAIVAVITNRGYCSGTFITKRHVLTAAHCFPTGTTSVRIETEYFSFSGATYQKHPNYNPNVISDQNDVAIVTIKQDAPVTPVSINTSRKSQAGDSVVTYGFGLDEDDQTLIDRIDNGQAALKATTLDVVSASDFAVKSISDGTGDTCQGDSGGSLLHTGNNGLPGVVAIVRAGPLPCQPEGGPSDNTNLQATSVLNFVKSAARGVTFN
jgi:secreted trypsin-like serine protease